MHMLNINDIICEYYGTLWIQLRSFMYFDNNDNDINDVQFNDVVST